MRSLLLTVGTLALMVIAGPITAPAQVIDPIEADIPFSFTVRNTTLPAGGYTIKRVTTSNEAVMEIRSDDGHSRMVFLVGNAQAKKTPEQSELIFDRVGDQYFLSKIFEEGDTIGAELQKSRTERKLEKEGAMIQVEAVTVPGAPTAGR